MSFESSSFEGYEHEFQSITSQIQKELGAARNNRVTTPTVSTSDHFAQCTLLVDLMSVEARHQDTTEEREELLSRIHLYTIQLKSLKDYSEEHIGNEEMKEKEKKEKLKLRNIAHKEVPVAGSSRSKSDSLYSTRVNIDRQNQTLERARQIMADTEEIAFEVSEELLNNRETLETSQRRAAELNDMTGQANQILTRMNKRWFK
mmetsp:Transcript_18057/g.32738  ORF Transcript_18057/g.32738 Transcript_18057/m.32738 type:complete len:203 (-) Transcript_18057:62-670(-)